jgi:hypothetical protein
MATAGGLSRMPFPSLQGEGIGVGSVLLLSTFAFVLFEKSAAKLQNTIVKSNCFLEILCNQSAKSTLSHSVRRANQLSQRVGLFVPMRGTTCPNGWDNCREVFPTRGRSIPDKRQDVVRDE